MSAEEIFSGELLNTVHPELRPVARRFLAMPPMHFDQANLGLLRAMKFPFPPALEAPAMTRLLVSGAEGAPDVPVFIVGAVAAGAKRPVLLVLHGGGFVCGSAGGDVRLLQEISLAVDCLVLSVEYRLAPEVPFPGSLEDNLTVLRWVSREAETLGGDPQNIAVMGGSAGGGHAAMLCLAARDRQVASIRMQVLLSPMLDDRTGSTRPVAPPFGNMMWSEASNRFGWTSLLGVAAGSDDVPAGAVPARSDDLRGLPPTFIGVGSIDLFLPECLHFAERLMAAGVATELAVVPGAFHGFDLIARDTQVSRQYSAQWQAALRLAFSANR
jgi:acetyl esterase/lipase